MRQSCNSLKCNKKFKLLAPHENTLKNIQRNLHYTAWKWFNGDRFKLIRVNLQKDFRSICGNIQYFAKWRKFQKIQKKSKKCVLSSLQLGLNLSNSTVVTFYFVPVYFFHRKQKKTHLCLFVCERWNRQTLVSRLKYWLWLAAAALGYSIEMREIFFENWNKILLKDLIEYFFLNQKLISFDDTNIKRQLNWSSNSWFCWVF